ncbi:MAG: hypothetical protein Q7W13_09520 [Bacteroidia bacterium]|nr:hypothetical protein [Bacteroidia bacterium]
MKIAGKYVMLKENNIEKMYLTPNEILEKYPILNLKYNWGTLDLGTMLKCKILDGHYDRSKRVGVIKESSLLKLIEYINDSIEDQKVKI